jgi:hypothetical protein
MPATSTTQLRSSPRIGYRTYLAWHKGEHAEALYEGFNLIARRRVAELKGAKPSDRPSQ